MERRQHSRKAVELQVYYVCIGADGREAAQDIGMARDISPGGMLLETSTPINTTDINITASTRDNQPLEATGSVIYSMQVEAGKYNTGIFFMSSSTEAARFVESVLLEYETEG